MRRVRLRITGRVQGVFFRESTRREATRLGLQGWVRNLDDGSVEAVVQGLAGDVETMVQWCHRGPQLARVESVQVTDEADAAALGDFRVER
ncbi:MAG: acylphosphatase [Myxococcota bacterium]|nr:acylphosphatase [Myxococcota bacterium]